MAHEVVDLATGYSFLKDFSCNRNQFRAGRYELELADHIVALGDMIMAIQHKTRNDRDARDGDSESKWFRQKVLRRARRQMEDTANYLRSYAPITVTNQLGQRVTIAPREGSTIAKLVVYRASRLLRPEDRALRLCTSDAGPIHLLADSDYDLMCRLLMTPAEIFEYLRFRADLWQRWPATISASEQAVLGQFLKDEPLAIPDERFAAFAEALQRDDADYSVIRRIMQRFTKGMYNISTANAAPEQTYPRILTTLALLGRNDLIAFQERMLLAIEHSGRAILPASAMISVSPSRCGFVFLSSPAKAARPEQRLIVLSELVECFKYRHRLDQCLGVALFRDKPYTHAEWALADTPWTEDPEVAARCTRAYDAGMLPEVTVKLRERYIFDGDILSRSRST